MYKRQRQKFRFPAKKTWTYVLAAADRSAGADEVGAGASGIVWECVWAY
jgi:hypothetical protein